MNAGSGKATVENSPRVWQNGSYVYGKIMVVNEEVNKIAQEIID